MRRRRLAVVGWWMGLLCGFFAPVEARVSVAPADELPIPVELARDSDAIILGVCRSSRSRWDHRSRLIFSDAVIAVERALKGKAEDEVTITVLGGVLPERNLGLLVPDMPAFHAGERILAFLKRDPASVFWVVGGSRGKLRIKDGLAVGRIEEALKDQARKETDARR